MNFSKSKYCEFYRCPKMAWLRKYKPEAFTENKALESRLVIGNEVGDLAMGLFGEYEDVTALKDDGRPDLTKMQERTQTLITQNKSVICEASFNHNGLYCAVDILRKTPFGYAIYEVKSATHDDNYIYVVDIAFQRYVLELCGINVTGTYLITVNTDYVFDGTLNLHRLFNISDMSNLVDKELEEVEENLRLAEEILSDSNEPQIDLSVNCKDPYLCNCLDFCKKEHGIPNDGHTVFDLYKLPFTKKIELYRNGVITFEDIYRGEYCGNEIRKRQVKFALEDMGTYLDKDGIRAFLNTLSYPLYFLDFETMQPVIPIYEGTRPYQQITFQYSLHYIKKENGELQHKEFLAESGPDPRRALAERLIADIPQNVCVLAYNRAFECTRIRELAEAFPDLAEPLINIKNHILDLWDPFKDGYYYNRAMGGSFSIKSVLLAIYPNDPALNYHNLEGIHNGGEAMDIFPKIQFMSSEEQQITRQQLLKYCELDTFAMVKIWQELIRVAKE